MQKEKLYLHSILNDNNEITPANDKEQQILDESREIAKQICKDILANLNIEELICK